MHTFAAEVVGSLLGGEVLGLSGDLGTGKTEFVRGLAKAFGSKDAVKSPSFTLLNHYRLDGFDELTAGRLGVFDRLDHSTIKHLIHVYLYRLEDSGSDLVSQIGLDEWLDRGDTITVIEWPERLGSLVSVTQRFSFSYGAHEMDRVVEKEEALPMECKSP